MKNFLKENWLKVGILLIVLLLVFFSVIFPRLVGMSCYKSSKAFILEMQNPENVQVVYEGIYKMCMDKWGY